MEEAGATVNSIPKIERVVDGPGSHTRKVAQGLRLPLSFARKWTRAARSLGKHVVHPRQLGLCSPAPPAATTLVARLGLSPSGSAAAPTSRPNWPDVWQYQPGIALTH